MCLCLCHSSSLVPIVNQPSFSDNVVCVPASSMGVSVRAWVPCALPGLQPASVDVRDWPIRATPAFANTCWRQDQVRRRGREGVAVCAGVWVCGCVGVYVRMCVCVCVSVCMHDEAVYARVSINHALMGSKPIFAADLTSCDVWGAACSLRLVNGSADSQLNAMLMNCVRCVGRMVAWGLSGGASVVRVADASRRRCAHLVR